MSWIQKFFCAVFPKRWAESMEASSRQWLLRCGCGRAISVWDSGGIRWKTAGRPTTLTRLDCPQCGSVTWHRLERAGEPPRA